MHDWSAGREVVCRRSRGAGDDEAVGLDAGDEAAADRDRQFDHAGQGALGEHDVVQHHACVVRLDAERRGSGEHQAFVVGRGTVHDGFERREQLVDPDLGEESEAAEVHAEDRDVASGLRGSIRHRQQRPVAAEDDDQIDLRGQIFPGERAVAGRAGKRRGAGFERGGDAMVAQPGAQLRQQLGRGKPLLGDDAGALDAWCHERRWSRNSTLPFAPVIGDGVEATGLNPTSRAAAETSSTTRDWIAVSRMTPLRISLRPASNCGLTIAITSAPGRRRGGTTGRIWRSEMNETSMVTRSTGPGRSDTCRWRALKCSITTTRGSLRSVQSIWPWPTSSATTRVAPRLRRTSVKPPVEAPMSSASRPSTAMPNVSSACASLRPPRPT